MLMQDENYKGCLMYIGSFAVVILCVYIYSCLKEPQIEKVERVKTAGGIMFRHSHSRYLCPGSISDYYCIIKGDSMTKPQREDKCINCNQTFRKHSYSKTKEEELMDETIRNAFLETPAE